MNIIISWRNTVSVLATILSFCFFFIVYQSYYPHENPIINSETNIISAIRRSNSVEVNYERTFVVTRPISITVERNVLHLASNLTFDTPTVHRVYKPGKYYAHRIIILPEGMPDGNYVYRTNIVWQPKGSVEDHYFSLPDEPFTMPKLKQ